MPRIGERRTLDVGREDRFCTPLMYAGLVGYEAFSIVVPTHGFGAVNSFYPTDIDDLRIAGYEFHVEDITPESLTLQYKGRGTARRTRHW